MPVTNNITSSIWHKINPDNRVDYQFGVAESDNVGPLFVSNSEPFALESMMIIVFCTAGEARFSLDMHQYSLRAPFMATLRVKKIGQIDYLSSDYRAFYYIFSEDFGNKLFYQLRDTYEFNRCVRERAAFAIDADTIANIQTNKSLILHAIAFNDNSYRLEAVRCLVQSLYFTYKTQYFTPLRTTSAGNHADNVVNKFMALVRDNHTKAHNLAFYANRMYMTPKYLSRVVKQATGKPAYTWINDALVQESKMLLKCSDKTIGEISDMLGFSSQVFFSKFFKNSVGMSPREYRKSNAN